VQSLITIYPYTHIVLLDVIVVLVALTGAFAGVLALALYLVDRRAVRAALSEGTAFMQKAKAALEVKDAKGNLVPPLQVVTSIATTAIANAAYTLMEDPEVTAKVKPLLLEALPLMAEGYARGSVVEENPGVALNRKRWGDRGGAIPRAPKQSDDMFDMFKPMIQQFIMNKVQGGVGKLMGGSSTGTGASYPNNGGGVIKW